MTTLQGPARMGSRSKAASLVRELPASLSNESVRIEFGDGALATTSFLDQLCIEVLLVRGARSLQLVGLDSYAQEIALDCARERGVADRVAFPPRD